MLNYSFYHLQKTDELSNVCLQRRLHSYLTLANTVEHSLSNIIVCKSGMLVFLLIPQMTSKRETPKTASSFFTL